MKTRDFIVLAESAGKYTEMVRLITSCGERDFEWGLSMIQTLQHDFHFVATPAAVLKLYNHALQLEQELAEARAASDSAKRECADMADVMAVSGSGNVINLPRPHRVPTGTAVLTAVEVAVCLSQQGFTARWEAP